MQEHVSRPKSPWLAALLAMLLVLVTEQLIERLAQGRALEQERVSVLTNLSAVRARLLGVINAHLLLVHGLTAVISAHPDIDQAEFARIAQGLVDARHALRNIAGAPDLVVSLMYPIADNEAAIGLDYRTHSTQSQTALRAMRTGRPILDGPLPLLQGGIGIILREPVFIPASEPDTQPRPWGLISAVIDADTLYRQAGLLDEHSQLQLMLRGTDGTGAAGPVFFGDPRIADQQPVTLDIDLPGGSWQLAAIPKGGWGQSSLMLWLIRLAGLVIALSAGVMTYLLLRRSLDLARTQGRLRTLLNTIPDLIWLKDPSGVYLACNPRFEQLYGASEAEILGKRDADFVPAEVADLYRAKDRAAIAAAGPVVNEEWRTFANDSHRSLFETINTPVLDPQGRVLGVLGIARDISAHKEAEERIRGLNRIHAVLTGINGAIIRMRDPERLLWEACRIAVEIGGFRMAWLGMADPESSLLRPVAHAGETGDYLEQLRIPLADTPRSKGPAGLALRQAQHCVCNDIAQDPRMTPWREAALALDYRAIAAFPIMVSDQVRGTLSLYTDQVGFFDAAELDLLDQLSTDIGFALQLLESDQASETLNRRLGDLLETMSDGFVSLNHDWRFQYVNPQAGILLGRDPAELVGTQLWSEFPDGIDRPIQAALRKAMSTGEMTRVEDYLETQSRWLENRIYPTRDGLSVFFSDITERKVAEQALRQQRDLLDRTSRLAQVGGWGFDVATGEGAWTDETARIHDLGPSQRVTVAEGLAVFSGPSRLAIEQAIGDAIENGRPYELELEMTTVKGARKWVRTIGLPVKENGRVVRLEGAIQDITSRTLAEREARERGAMLDLVFQVLPDLFFLMDEDGTIRDYRASRDGDLYAEPEQFLGRRMQDVLPPAIAEIFERNFVLLEREGGLVTYEYDLEMPDGARRFEARLSHIPETTRLIAVVRDISERVRAQAALEAQRRETDVLATLLERSSQPMAVGYLDGRLGLYNQAFLDLIGYDRTEVGGANWLQDLTPPEWRETERAALESIHRDGQPLRYEKEYTRKDGSRVPVELYAHEMLSALGEVDYYYAFVTDITERKQRQEAVQRMNTELEERVQARTAELAAINKELETFTYSVSHDLKAPLRGIDGYSRLLLEDHLDQLNEEGQLFLRNVRQGVEQMGELIEDLLAYSRMERRGLVEVPVDLGELMTKLLAEREDVLRATGAKVQIDLAGLTARADPHGLAIAMRNLLDNALKFHRPGEPPLIEMSGRAAADVVEVSIRDHGIGFDMRFHDRIFDIFQRLQRAEDYPGTGIGLAIVRKAVLRMGGRIWAESAPGQGATFHLELTR
ncbi:PAS domain S-box protein [Thiorhodococcus mannitoliphagus]|nr:PAS domain S-box protein [Thiorhodococcus mannitoliphagus]